MAGPTAMLAVPRANLDRAEQGVGGNIGGDSGVQNHNLGAGVTGQDVDSWRRRARKFSTIWGVTSWG